MKRRGIPVILCAWVCILVFYIAMKFYAQYRPIKIYVSRVAPMPVELANGLHMKEHGINTMITIESSYENSENKILSLDEIRRIRSQIIWSTDISPFFDSLTIQSSNKVLVRRTTSSVMRQYELVKSGDRWVVESSTRSTLNRIQPRII
jgi:hypothetical protein